MKTISERLKEYGFREEQIKKLLKGKRLNTVHGEYILKDGVLTLNGIEKAY